MPNGITKETFLPMANADKLNVLFDLSVENNQEIKSVKKGLDKRKKIDAGASVIGGAFGAFLAIGGKALFWK